MPGNRSIYNDAIKKGHNAAWDGQWKKAVEEYRRALAEFPDDWSVHANLAQALEALGQWESALKEFQAIVKVNPRDPDPLMRVAVLQERLRRRSEASATWLGVAELHLQSKQIDRAIAAWKKAAELEPDRADVRQRLVDVYMKNGDAPLASMEFMELARIYQKRGDLAKARNLAEQALGIDPKNQTARAYLEDAGRESVLPTSGSSPVDEAQKAALSRLAETVLEEPVPLLNPADERRNVEARPRTNQIQIDALIARAVDAQMNHRVNEAIDAYRKLIEAGIVRSEIKFNLGLLYFESMRYDEAIGLLTQTLGDKNYSLASHYALGQCYRAQGKMDNAVEHFLQVVKIVDLTSVNREQADDLISVYEGLAESYAAKGDRVKAESFSQSLEEFLTSRGWEDKVAEVRRHLDALRADDSQISLAELIEMPGSDKVLEALALSQEYARRDKLGAASEECLRAIELAPNYLPGHIRLAEILVKQNRLSEAQTKYQTVADLCVIRGDYKRAEGLYRSEIKIAPDDVIARSKFIDLLLQQERTDDALEQYLELGELYVRRGELAKAAEKLNEGARLASRTNSVSPSAITLRHRVAEMRARAGDWQGALAAYQEIHQLSPADERAHFYLVDLELRLGQFEAGIRDLDDLLLRYHNAKELRKAVGVLDALTQSYPAKPELVIRLARIHELNGDQEKAIAVLDALGDAQLGAGDKVAAAATIRRIIAMNPPRIADYQNLLAHLSE